MNGERESNSLDTKRAETKKFDIEAFDPGPLELEDLKGVDIALGSVTKKRLKIDEPMPKSSKMEKEPEEQISAFRSALTAFSVVGQIGIVMFASVAIGLLGGIYIDRWLGTGHVFMIILTLLGVASGFRAVYLMVKKLMN